MLINASNLFKLFVKNVPKCENCIYFEKINENGKCKKFGDILYARASKDRCTITGKYFIQVISKIK